MLRVMRDPEAHPKLRAAMAVAAAPYVHPKAGETSKKQTKDEAAKQISRGARFGAGPAPGAH